MNIQVGKSREQKTKMRAECKTEEKNKREGRGNTCHHLYLSAIITSLKTKFISRREAHMEPHSQWQSGYQSPTKMRPIKSLFCCTCKHRGSNWLSSTGRINLNMFPHQTPKVLECQLQTSHPNTAKSQGVETHSSFIDFQQVEGNPLPALWQRAIIPQIICADWW